MPSMFTLSPSHCVCPRLERRCRTSPLPYGIQQSVQRLYVDFSSRGSSAEHSRGSAGASTSSRCRAGNGAGNTAVAAPEVSDAPKSPYLTGGMSSTTSGATSPFTDVHLAQPKHIVIVRHGQTTWNLAKRMQVCPLILPGLRTDMPI